MSRLLSSTSLVQPLVCQGIFRLGGKIDEAEYLFQVFDQGRIHLRWGTVLTFDLPVLVMVFEVFGGNSDVRLVPFEA
jgi:hypothetical protein